MLFIAFPLESYRKNCDQTGVVIVMTAVTYVVHFLFDCLFSIGVCRERESEGAGVSASLRESLYLHLRWIYLNDVWLSHNEVRGRCMTCLLMFELHCL